MAKLAFRSHGLAGISFHSLRFKQSSLTMFHRVVEQMQLLVREEKLAEFRRALVAFGRELCEEAQGLRRWLGITPRQGQLCARVALICFCLTALGTAAWFAVVNGLEAEPTQPALHVVRAGNVESASIDPARLVKKVSIQTREGTKTFYVVRDQPRDE